MYKRIITDIRSEFVIVKNYRECYIAFLDILGFKNIIRNSSCNEIFGIFSQDLQHRITGLDVNHRSILEEDAIHMKIMSDSICFYIDASVRNSFFALVATLRYYQADLLRREKPIFIRGAITKGKIFAEGDITYGPGFIEAYQMEEKSARFPRIIMTGELVDGAKATTDADIYPILYTYLYRDFDELFMIDYFDAFEGHDTYDTESPNLLRYIQNVLNCELDSSVREKYQYAKSQLLRWYKPQDFSKVNHT